MAKRGEYKNTEPGEDDKTSLVSVAELSKILGVSIGWVYNRVKSKSIPFFKFGTSVRFNVEDVLKYFSAGSYVTTEVFSGSKNDNSGATRSNNLSLALDEPPGSESISSNSKRRKANGTKGRVEKAGEKSTGRPWLRGPRGPVRKIS